jgi:hypothetical protein
MNSTKHLLPSGPRISIKGVADWQQESGLDEAACFTGRYQTGAPVADVVT